MNNLEIYDNWLFSLQFRYTIRLQTLQRAFVGCSIFMVERKGGK